MSTGDPQTSPFADARNPPIPANPVARLLALVQLLQSTIRLGDVSLFEMWRRADFLEDAEVSALIDPASPRETFERIAAAVALAAEARQFATAAMGGLPPFYERGFDSADRALGRSDLNASCSGISGNLEAARSTLDFATHLLEQKGLSAQFDRGELRALRTLANELVEAVLSSELGAELKAELAELAAAFRRRVEEAWFLGPRAVVQAFDQLAGAARRNAEAVARAPGIMARISAILPTVLKVVDLGVRVTSLYVQMRHGVPPAPMLPPFAVPSIEPPAPMRSLPPGPSPDAEATGAADA